MSISRRAENGLQALLSWLAAGTTPRRCRPQTSNSSRSFSSVSCPRRTLPPRCRRAAAANDAAVRSDQRRTVYTAAGGGLSLEHSVVGRDLTEKTTPAANLPTHPPRVAVLGGGVTGLTTAYYLDQELPPGSKVVLYEADTRPGGWIRSERVPVDYKGTKTEVLFERGPRLTSLAETGGRLDRMVMYDLIMNHALVSSAGNDARQRWIWSNGRLMPVPPFDSLSQIFENTVMWAILPVAFFNYARRVLLGWGGPLPQKDMSAAEWIYEIFGSRQMADTLASAALHGIWGGDVHKLSALSTFGSTFHSVRAQAPPAALMRVPMREFRFMHNFAYRRPEVLHLWQTESAPLLMLERYGMEALPETMAHSLSSAPDVEMRLGDPVKAVSYDRARDVVMVEDSSGKAEPYDKVISTLPAKQLAKITGSELPTLSEFHSVTIMTVNIWYPREDLVPYGIGYLIPGSVPFEENPERALGVFFDSCVGIGRSREALGPHVTPEPGTKVFVLMGGHYYDGTQPPSEGQAIDQAKALLERQLGIPRDTPCHASARLARECLPQHNVGHSGNLTRLAGELSQAYGNRLSAIGGSFTKPGVTGALRCGWDIVDDVANHDFLSTGLEDWVEDMALHPPLVDVPSNSIFGTSGMRRRRG